MPTGVRLLHQLGVLALIPATQQHVLRGMRFVIGETARVEGDFPDIGDGFRTGLGVTRLVLDEYVLRHAQAHRSVEVHEGAAATDVRSDRNAVEILTNNHRYRARVVVGADGLRSLVRNRLGFGLIRGRRQRFGVRTHYQLPPGTQLDQYVCVDQNAGDQCFTTPVGQCELQVALLFEKTKLKPFAGRLDLAFDQCLAARPQLNALLAEARREHSDIGVRAIRRLAALPSRRPRTAGGGCRRIFGSFDGGGNFVGLARRDLGFRSHRRCIATRRPFVSAAADLRSAPDESDAPL